MILGIKFRFDLANRVKDFFIIAVKICMDTYNILFFKKIIETRT